MTPFRAKLAAFLAVVGLGLTIGIVAQSPTNVLNPASDLAGKTLVTAEGNRTITGTWSFNVPVRLNPGTSNAPGIVSTSDQTTGWQLGVSAIGGSVSGTQRLLLNTSGLTLFGTQLVNSSGNLQVAAFNSGTSASSSTFWRGDSTWSNTLTSPSINTSVVSPLMLGCGIRLTLTSGTPVTTADVTGATTIYATPYSTGGVGAGNCAFYDGGAAWTTIAFTETSIALGTLTSGLPYDVFCYNNSGTMACDAPVAWTNTTTRATALAVQNGVLVKTGLTTRRYIGTFYTSSTTTTESSCAKQYVWNYYNRVPRCLRRIETTGNWTYTTNTLRQANGSTLNQVEAVIGVAEATLDLTLIGNNSNSAGSIVTNISIGEDSTTTADAAVSGGMINNVAAQVAQTLAHLTKQPSVGYHKWVWLEISPATGITTWNGTNFTANTGLSGTIQG